MRIGALVGYKSEKAAQMAAFFAQKNGRNIEKLKLIKLLYLAEREYVSRYQMGMLFDEYYSLPHGPVCSSSLNGINGTLDAAIWSKYIKREDRIVMPAAPFERDDLDRVSDAEWNVLCSIWNQFGWMTSGQIRKYTHQHCPEYTEVESGRMPISYYEMLDAVGVDGAVEIAKDIAALRRAEGILSA